MKTLALAVVTGFLVLGCDRPAAEDIAAVDHPEPALVSAARQAETESIEGSPAPAAPIAAAEPVEPDPPPPPAKPRQAPRSTASAPAPAQPAPVPDLPTEEDFEEEVVGEITEDNLERELAKIEAELD